MPTGDAGDRENLNGLIEALEAARASIRDDPVNFASTSRRIAETILSRPGPFSAGILSAAREIGAADEATLPGKIESLLVALRSGREAAKSRPAVILVVDDDADLRAAYASRFSGPGHDVRLASSCAEAREILLHQEVSLVILDLLLPDSDGRLLLRQIRETPRTSMIPVLVVSIFAKAASVAECYALGADAFLPKPVDLDILASTVSAHLRRISSSSREAFHDRLTGLPNRAAFLEELRRARAQAVRERSSLSLAMVNLDHTAILNETYGSGTGDTAIANLAATVRATLRVSDAFARWGGDGFAAFFPNTATREANLALDKALTRLHSERFQAPDGRTFQLGFSAGLTDVEPDEPLEDVIARAEWYLSRAKLDGRCRIVGVERAVAPAKTKILMVEDDADMARLVTHRLSSEDFEVIHCPNGESALARAPSTRASLVLLDIVLPGINGLDVLQRLRGMPEYRDIPIVMATSLGDKSNLVRAFELGASDYIVKPFTPTELLLRMRRLLPRTSSPVPPAPHPDSATKSL